MSRLLFLYVTICFFGHVSSYMSSKCSRDQSLLVYKVILTGLWSRDTFPKHFPDWRPKAHFSKLVGRSHDEKFKLFRLNERVSEGVRLFTETGSSEILNELSQGDGGVFDEFFAPPMSSVGKTEAEFFVDANHSKVSVMSRVTPSPDWFIGLDSIDLCNDGTWVTSLTIDAHPLDSGTDNGFTFTSPNWKTEPYSVVSRLTPKNPNHPASSFYYTDVDQLPPMASFQFLKVKEYELSQVFNHPRLEYKTDGYDIGANDVSSINIRPLESNFKQSTYSISSPLNPKPALSPTFINYLNTISSSSSTTQQEQQKDLSTKNKKRKLKRFRSPRNSHSHSRHDHRSLFNWGAN